MIFWIYCLLVASTYRRLPQPLARNFTPHTLSTHQPSTLNPQPSTLNPQPSTLNPQLSTLNPQPPTSNPQPSTLNLQPSICHRCIQFGVDPDSPGPLDNGLKSLGESGRYCRADTVQHLTRLERRSKGALRRFVRIIGLGILCRL